jgi:anti-sigma factor ChrR (cupin superfamily)
MGRAVMAARAAAARKPKKTAASEGLLDVGLRRVISTDAKHFRPDNRYGRPLPGITRLPLSHDKASGHDMYLIRFARGAKSLPHEHAGPEEFLVMEGELVDSDGKVFKAGDFVHYEAGTKHHSVSPGGCLLLVVLRRPNKPL